MFIFTAGRAAAALVLLGAASASAQDVTALEARIDAISDLYGTAGASVRVLRGDEIVFEHHYGFRDVEAQRPTNADTAYTIWSMSKLFFNIEIMRAVEAGQIDLDATLGQVFDDLPAEWQSITLRQAWSHMSGLPDIWSNGIPDSFDTALEAAKSRPMDFETGTRSAYNQTNFALLWQHLEAVSGEVYLDRLAVNQLDRFELRHTSFSLETAGSDQSLNYRMSRDDDTQSVVINLPSFPNFVYSSVGAHSSMNDLTRWSQALVRGEHLPVEALVDYWWPQNRTDGSLAEHTHGFEYEDRGDYSAVGHGGGGRVNLRHYFEKGDPETSLTVIYLDNGGLWNFNHRGFSALIADSFIPGLASEEEQLMFTLAAAARAGDVSDEINALRELAGRREVSGRFQRELYRIGYAGHRLHGNTVALPVFSFMAELFSDEWDNHYRVGLALREEGRLDEALVAFRRALELAPGDEDILTAIAEVEAEL